MKKTNLKTTIEEFLKFNSNRLASWKAAGQLPIIGMMVCNNKDLGFGIRFYKEWFSEPEDLGQGITFIPIQIIEISQ